MNLKLETTPRSEPEPSCRGIKENPSFEGRVRDVSLFDSFGVRQAAIWIPDHNLTPRIVELLDEILGEIERHHRGGGPIKLERVTPASSA